MSQRGCESILKISIRSEWFSRKEILHDELSDQLLASEWLSGGTAHSHTGDIPNIFRRPFPTNPHPTPPSLAHLPSLLKMLGRRCRVSAWRLYVVIGQIRLTTADHPSPFDTQPCSKPHGLRSFAQTSRVTLI